MSVEAIMTRTVLSVEPNTSVREAIRLIEDSDIRHLPVIEAGRVVGMLSDRDLREYRIPIMLELERYDDERDRSRVDALLDTPVSELMSSDVISVESRETIASAIEAMLRFRVGAVPVIDHFTEQLVGILSYVDVLRYTSELLAADEDEDA